MFKEQEQSTYSTQVIIAALNEQEGIGLTITELYDALGNSHVIMVDGKSTDQTVEIAKNLGAQIAFRMGKAKAMLWPKGLSI